MKKHHWYQLIGFIVLCELIGILGSFFTVDAISQWYGSLVRPDLSPPNWIFGPVWTLLYALMGAAAFFVWREENIEEDYGEALPIFFVQLLLNAAWSFFFFGLQNPFLAFVDIVVLWFAIILTMITFYKVSKKAAYLLIPYLLWVSFAAYLNFSIWQLNPNEGFNDRSVRSLYDDCIQSGFATKEGFIPSCVGLSTVVFQHNELYKEIEKLAKTSQCGEKGIIGQMNVFDDRTNEAIFDFVPHKKIGANCFATCLVDVATKTSSVNTLCLDNKTSGNRFHRFLKTVRTSFE